MMHSNRRKWLKYIFYDKGQCCHPISIFSLCIVYFIIIKIVSKRNHQDHIERMSILYPQSLYDTLSLGFEGYGPVVLMTPTADPRIAMNTDVQSQNAVSAHCTSEQILPFGFARQNTCPASDNSRVRTGPYSGAPWQACQQTDPCAGAKTPPDMSQVYIAASTLCQCRANVKWRWPGIGAVLIEPVYLCMFGGRGVVRRPQQLFRWRTLHVQFISILSIQSDDSGTVLLESAFGDLTLKFYISRFTVKIMW